MFDVSRTRRLATSKVGLMKLRPLAPGEYRYAVAIREGSTLWLTLWVRRSPKGEFFVISPISDQKQNAHTSYHLNGTLHMKCNGHKFLPQKRQPLTEVFHGTENLGGYRGYCPKTIGAICDPTPYSGVVEVPTGILGPRNGIVTIELVERGCKSILCTEHIVLQEIFRDTSPWIVITIASSS